MLGASHPFGSTAGPGHGMGIAWENGLIRPRSAECSAVFNRSQVCQEVQ
jgi:hypothetical protein